MGPRAAGCELPRGTANHMQLLQGRLKAMSDNRPGLVVGRFQPLHFGHMEYIDAALRKSTRLYIGITHPDKAKFFYHEADTHRSQPQANPFDYEARHRMVVELMHDLRIGPDEFEVVPIRLDQPLDCRAQVPLGTIAYITIYDNWGEVKRQLFESMGFRVEVLWRRRETITRGHVVRARIREGQEWHHLVPPSTVRVVQGWLDEGNRINGDVRSRA